MNTVTINIYKFNELSEDAKKNAVNRLSDINVSHEWWDGIYEDAKNIGLSITGFDLDRNRHATGIFERDLTNVADLIIENHGEDCDTYKLAKQFLTDRDELVAKYSDGVDTSVVSEENEYDFDNECDDLEEEFKRAILEEYACMLQNEYEYQTEDEAIIETIESNDYDFTEDGKLY